MFDWLGIDDQLLLFTVCCFVGFVMYKFFFSSKTISTFAPPYEKPRVHHQPVNVETLKEYTISEINAHNKDDDCWLIIGTKVYDVTKFVNDHPGGVDSIVGQSGPNRDATAGFKGDQHPDTVEDQVRQYLCGKLKEYSREEISRHNTREDCWIVVDDKVYDVTNFVSTHPGGPVILKNAGGDSSEGFHSVEAHTRISMENPNYSTAEIQKSSYLVGAVRTEKKLKIQ
eukprot:TRINITY_DN1191_c0_g1_i2.p1 TRINITY_DN1191_c0_g1~~TRINITY_DN1191_c0_g1_i2.p1  ORF type:complete len:227 (+),score=40.82 TRINITY_DN1191_c0_g1_i2:374-1054(+)